VDRSQALLHVATPDPRVGAVVLTYNRVDTVLQTVRQLRALPERPTVVVVDNGSSDGTPERLRKLFPEVRCITLHGNPGAAGRNAGAIACERPYLAFCDDDACWEPGAMGRAANALEQYPHLAAVAGRVLVGPDGRTDPLSEQLAASPLISSVPLPGPAILGFLAGCVMIRRSAFLQVGGYEQRFFIGGEEELLALDLARAGWSLAYLEDVTIRHAPSPASRDNHRRRWTQERNRLWVFWMRRPARHALAETARVARHATRDVVARRAVVEAVRGLPWALRRRRVVPPAVERQIRQLERRRSDADRHEVQRS
jgi:GT2 family glycosyltransferase